MKIIDCNNWAPHNKSNIPIAITDPLINAKGLFVFFAWFYYRLVNMLENILDKGNILDEGGYFDDYHEDGHFYKYENGYSDEDYYM
jgi:hypothetical protein